MKEEEEKQVQELILKFITWSKRNLLYLPLKMDNDIEDGDGVVLAQGYLGWGCFGMGLFWFGVVSVWDCFGLRLYWFGTVLVWGCYGLGLFRWGCFSGVVLVWGCFIL